MTITDILILVGLLFYMSLGFRDGFFKKVFGVLGFWGGLIVATRYLTPAGELVKGWLDVSKETSLIIGFCGIFLLVSLAMNLFYRWFGKSGSDTLKIRSRLAGALIGGIQGVVAISLFLILFNFLGEPDEEAKQGSYFYAPLIKVAPVVFDYTTTWIPESKEFLQIMEENFQKPHTSE